MNKNMTAVILIVLAIGVYFTFTKDRWNETQMIRGINDQYVQAIDNANRLIEVRDKVRDDFNNLSAADNDRLTKMLPTSVDNIRLIIDLNSIARSRGLVLKGVKAAAASERPGGPMQAINAPQPKEPGVNNAIDLSTIGSANLDTINVTFSTEASYQQIIQFMRDIESNLRLMDITKVSVNSSETGLYELSIDLKTYWLRQNK